LALVAVLSVACSDDTSDPADNTVSAIEIVSAPGPRTVAEIVDVRVRLRSSRDRAVTGTTVSFQAQSGSGSVAPATTTSNASGEAGAQWTLDTRAGRQTLQVSSGAASTTIEVQAQPGAPASLSKQAGDAQVGAPGAPLATQVAVSISDAHNNAIDGVSVSFVVRSGGGSIAPATGLTDASGIARATWTLGSGGSQELEARAGSLAPAVFRATADPGFNTLSIAPATWTIPLNRQVRFAAWTGSSAHAPDIFDFVAILDNVNGFANRTYLGLRNDVEGIGVAIFNNNAAYGGSTRLLGTISFPADGLFDLAALSASHEIGHRWINFLDNTFMLPGVPHWPLSTMARDVMGFSLLGGVGGDFPYEVRARSDGQYELVCSPPTGEFSDLSLYLMGLIPAADVRPHVVLNNQQLPLQCGSVSSGITFTVNDIIAANGVRRPDHTQSPKSFRVGTLVLSRGRLLNADEMAFFSHMAARGEARTELQYSSGFSRGMTRPFFLATGGRATLQTRMW
jgi:hypothetical protein